MVESKFNKFVDSVAAKSPVTFDPFTILLLISIIINVIRIIQNCNKTASDTKLIAGNATSTEKALILIQVKKAIGRRRAKQYGDAIVESIIARTHESSIEEIQALFDEAENDD